MTNKININKNDMNMIVRTTIIDVESLVVVSIILVEILIDVVFHYQIQNFGAKTPHAKLKSRFDCKNSLQTVLEHTQ
jgi:hypothetical protein